MKILLILLLPLLITSSLSLRAQTNDTGASNPQLDLTIYHLEGRRSERIVWLCEELGLTYTLKYKTGDLRGSMATIRELNPLMPVAPTVTINGLVMVESGAILELLVDRYAPGQLVPDIASADYMYYLQWMHFAEGSYASRSITEFVGNRIRTGANLPKPPPSGLVDMPKVLSFLDAYLSEHPYFGGEEFSLADIMMLFPTDLTEAWKIADLSSYTHLLAWREKVKGRPGYQKMLASARPNGIPSM